MAGQELLTELMTIKSELNHCRKCTLHKAAGEKCLKRESLQPFFLLENGTT